MLLDAFQECKQRGDWATLFLETKNGEEFATLKVKLSSPQTRRAQGQTSFGSSPKKKTPSTLRRNRARLEKFMKERRIQETWVPKTTSTPSTKSQAMDFPALENKSVDDCNTVSEMPSEAADKLEGLDASQESNEHSEQDINIIGNQVMKSLEEGLEEAFAPFKKQLGDLNRELCLLQNITKEGDDDKHENFDKNAENNANENTDNIEAAKIWAVNQKQSIKGSQTQV